MTAFLSELKRKAEAATKGRWHVVTDLPAYSVASDKLDIAGTLNRKYRAPYENFGCLQRDAEWIAAANPATVLVLIEAIEALRAGHAEVGYELSFTPQQRADRSREALAQADKLMESLK